MCVKMTESYEAERKQKIYALVGGILFISVVLAFKYPKSFLEPEPTGTKQTYLVGEEITSYRKVFLGETMYTINTAYYSGCIDGCVVISVVVVNGYGITSFDLNARLGTIIQLGEITFKVTNYNYNSLELEDVSADPIVVLKS